MCESHNEFEWIAPNVVVLPLLLPLCGGVASIMAVGCGSSRIEQLLQLTADCRGTVYGVDIDKSALADARKRWCTENYTDGNCGVPNVQWLHADLAQPCSSSSCGGSRSSCGGSSNSSGGRSAKTTTASAAGSGGASDNLATVSECGSPAYGGQRLPRASLVFDKGTLDYVICEETERLACYLRNMRALTEKYYVLISFRDRDMLVQIVGLVGLVLVKEIEFAEGSFRCFVFASAAECASAVSETDLGSGALRASAEGGDSLLALRIQRIIDRTYTGDGRSLLTPELRKRLTGQEQARAGGPPATRRGAPSSGNKVHSYTLHQAYEEVIPRSLQTEYTFDLFCEDLQASHPGAVAQGRMSASEMVEFVEVHQ